MQCSYSLPEGPRFAAGHWYKTNLKTPRDTMFVPPSKGSVEYIITSRICRLRINSLKESDAGIYDFRVTPLTFAQMKDSHGVTLAVSDSLQVKLSSDVVTEGDSVTLTCGASCTLDANTTYVWHKNTNDLPFTMVNMNSSLHLNPVSMEDEGIYSCALRGHEDHPSTAVSLRVRSKMGMIMAVVTGCGMAVLAAAILSCVIICNMRRKHRIMETDSGADTQVVYFYTSFCILKAQWNWSTVCLSTSAQNTSPFASTLWSVEG
ncbi:sialoadhesin-like [Clupea harengus]|uniref:Sialoadhesin-like n=1 Tax=Clupea harengus TaxID=7950 RepID=A0A8M1KNF2_CLUHA|nr:sialoadhesin-like [Clupea harengus]